MKNNFKIISPYELTKQAGLKSIKRDTTTTPFFKRTRQKTDTSFWPSSPPDALDNHPLAKKAHIYGSSLK